MRLAACPDAQFLDTAGVGPGGSHDAHDAHLLFQRGERAQERGRCCVILSPLDTTGEGDCCRRRARSATLSKSPCPRLEPRTPVMASGC
jgi:hypothetical protein